MPRDINGVYTLPAGNPVVPGTVISTTWANATLNDIAAALTQSATKDNSVLTGIPTAPTPVAGTNTTQLATTAFVQSQKTTSATDTTSGRVWRTDDLVKTTSATDTTADRILKVGDFGFNGPSIAAGANADLNWPPFAKTDANARFKGYSWVNMPTGLSSSAAVFEWQPYSGDWGRQLFVDTIYRKSYERYWYNGTTWSPWVEVATSANSLGQGQTWQNLSASRALETTYTNTTGRPIMVNLIPAGTVAQSASITVGGVQAAYMAVGDTSHGGTSTLSAIVPSASTYSCSASKPSWTWLELR